MPWVPIIDSKHPIPLLFTTPTISPSFRGRRIVPRLVVVKMSLRSSPSANDFITSLGRLFWGSSLPPQLLISTVRTVWSFSWHLMMRQLAPSSPSGSYSRPLGAFPTVPGHTRGHHFHLYAALPCPWAHRTLIVRALLGLETLLPVSIASPGPDGPWVFLCTSGARESEDLVPGPDRENGRRTLREVYGMRRGGYDGRATVPMLWDVDTREPACNESYEILEFLNSGFPRPEGGGSLVDLAPPELKEEIDKWNCIVYPNINNGVYRCGFAQSQEAYDSAVSNLFGTLDMIESHLSTARFLCGDVLTLADVCLFTTLVRFDLVYNNLFKCTKKKLIEYPNIYGYTSDIYQIPNVAETCNFEAIMDGYYKTLFPLNPSGIQPVIPTACEHGLLSKPHRRDSLSSRDNIFSYMSYSNGG